MSADQFGGAGDEGVEVGTFLRLDQTQVAGGVGEVGEAREAAQDGEAGGGEGAAEHGLVTRAAHAVEDDPGDADLRVVAGKALCQRSDRLRHAGGVDDEDDGEAEDAGEVGGGAAALGRGAVEEAHRAFDQEGAVACGEVCDAGGGHGPGVEVEAGAGAGGFVKRGSM